MTTHKHPVLACVLSALVPGLGQLYVGDRAKGVALLVMVIGIGLTVALSHSALTAILLGLVYLAVVIPAAMDAYKAASGSPGSSSNDSMGYVIGMLVAVGPFALPLLWQSRRFSRTAKIVWTVAVIAIALLFVATVALLGPALEQLLQQAPILP